MEISTSISKTEGRKRTDTATVHLFTIHYSLFAICLAASAFAHDIETTSWGVCWKRLPSMPESIGPTNTPGSDAFCEYRLTAPAAYAFMDGFDTRLHAASCTNIVDDEMASDGFPKVTNTTHRFAFFDSLERRKENVRKLCPWYDPVEYYGHYMYSGDWGSTFMDSLQFVYPKRHDFGWTTDPFSEFYTPDGKTGWFSVFYGLKKTSVFSPHEYLSKDGYPENLFKYEGVAYRILNDVSFYEPDWHVFCNRELDATPFTFEVVLSNAFENVYCTNMLSSNRRLFPQQLAGCNQALALMDKTVRSDDAVYAITNRSDKYFHFRMFADGTYGGSVTITESAGGGYTASPLNLSFAPGSVTVTNAVAITNEECALNAPCLSISVPSCAFGASLFITNVSASLNVDSSGWYYYSGTLSELIDEFLEISGASETIVHVETYVDDYGIVITIREYTSGEEGMFYVDIPKIASGNYIPKGKASFSSQYSAIEAYEWHGGGHHENWPANRTYLKYNGINTTFVSSYAATRAYCHYESEEVAPIWFTYSDYDPTTTEQWDERVGYGYRAKTHKMNFPSQYLARMAQEIGTIASKMFDLAPDYDDPSQYVGVDEGDFRNMCERADEWALSINEEQFVHYGDCIFVLREGGEYTFWIVGSEVEYKGGFPIMTVSASLNLVDDEVLDVYDFTDKPFLFNSKIRSVSEAEWEFPQVMMKD